MAKLIHRILDIEPDQATRVYLMLGMGFFMGVFLATLDVAASTLFLQNFDEQTDLPLAILLSGFVGLVFTSIYNFFQSRISFKALAIATLLLMTAIVFGFQVAFEVIEDPKEVFRAIFILLLPLNYLTLLVFWGTFGRIFTLRESKKIIGSIDTGQLIASILALFSIPILLQLKNFTAVDLFKVSLFASGGVLTVTVIIALKRLFAVSSKKKTSRVSYGKMFRSRYVVLMASFVIVSMIALSFVDFAFLNATGQQFSDQALATFLSLFEATVVIFSFLFQTFVTDRIISMYGLRFSLIINPLLILAFTGIATFMGLFFGFEKAGNDTFIFFFIIIAMSKLFIDSLKDALDGPAFKLYFLPIDSDVRFDVQVKIEGVIVAFAGLLAGLIFLLMNRFGLSLIYVTIFTIPLLLIWYFVTNKMHAGYKDTLQSTLMKNKESKNVKLRQEFAVNQVLSNEIQSPEIHTIIYSLKIMERLEPALFEKTVVQMTQHTNEQLKNYAIAKTNELNLQYEPNSEIHQLATQALGKVEDLDVIKVSKIQLEKLGKSLDPSSRITASRLLRTQINNKNIFLLLELLRDMNDEVRLEAIKTARKVKREETWPVLIELTDSRKFGHAASSALIEVGEPAIHSLEMAFSKSGQRDSVMLKIIAILGRIGGNEAIHLLWNKVDYPDKRISSEVLIWLRYFNYEAKQERERQTIFELLDDDISKAIWNISALEELPDISEYYYLRGALREELEGNYDHIFMLLSILYDKESIQLVRENIETGTSEGITFALELMDIFIDKDLRPKLFPLFDDLDPKDKLTQLQIFFPRESYVPREVLNFILNRNFNQANRWTKACALHSLAFIDDFKVTKAMAAQLFNNDYLLQETSAWVIYHKDRRMFEKISIRLPVEHKKHLEMSISQNQLIDGLDDGAFLNIEMAMFMKNTPLLGNIKGHLLCDLSDRMQISQYNQGDQFTLNDIKGDNPVIVVAKGVIEIELIDGELINLSEKDIFGELFVLEDELKINKISCLENSILFTISSIDFYHIMGENHHLVQDMIHMVGEKLKIDNIITN